jgi:hypothetical protein
MARTRWPPGREPWPLAQARQHRDGTAGGCQRNLGPADRSFRKTTSGVSRLAGQAGTQATDPIPAPRQTSGSRAGSTIHILPAEYERFRRCASRFPAARRLSISVQWRWPLQRISIHRCATAQAEVDPGIAAALALERPGARRGRCAPASRGGRRGWGSSSRAPGLTPATTRSALSRPSTRHSRCFLSGRPSTSLAGASCWPARRSHRPASRSVGRGCGRVTTGNGRTSGRGVDRRVAGLEREWRAGPGGRQVPGLAQ